MTGATTRVRRGGTTHGQVMKAGVEPAGRRARADQSYTDDEGTVVLDWQLLVMSARA